MASALDAVVHIGKAGLIPEVTASVAEVLEAREILKISVLKNCDKEPAEMAKVLAERTHSEVVQVIGRKIILYKESNNKQRKKIILP